MIRYGGQQSRQHYLATQVNRSEAKFEYCKVSIQDVCAYRTVLQQVLTRTGQVLHGPVVCLGVRNGREVDLFRLEWFGPTLLSTFSRRLERRTYSFTSWVPWLEAVGRADVASLTASSVVGVEVNPRAARRDVWIGSFDDMPAEWQHKFAVVFSNAFDHSYDPERTAREWKRILQPGGFLIVCFDSRQQATSADPIGEICLPDLERLFGGRLVYFHERGSRNGYSEVILQL